MTNTILWVIVLVSAILSSAAIVVKIYLDVKHRRQQEKFHQDRGRKMYFDTFGEDIFKDKNYTG